MVKRGWFVLTLFFALLGISIWEQCYIDFSCNEMDLSVEALKTCINQGELEKGKEKCLEIEKFWSGKEVALSLFMDFRDIEKIGTQITLIKSHLENEDFKLALVETNVLDHAIKTFRNTVCFDWQNIV